MDLKNFTAEMVDIEDIAYGLSGLFRFCGQTRLSVAEHSVSVGLAMQSPHPERHPCPLRFAALLHDAHEAYLGDITRPLKDWLSMLGAGQRDGFIWYEILAREVQSAIHERFGLTDIPQWTRFSIAVADTGVGNLERERFLYPGIDQRERFLYPGIDRPLSPRHAEGRFLDAFTLWRPEQ